MAPIGPLMSSKKNSKLIHLGVIKLTLIWMAKKVVCHVETSRDDGTALPLVRFRLQEKPQYDLCKVWNLLKSQVPSARIWSDKSTQKRADRSRDRP